MYINELKASIKKINVKKKKKKKKSQTQTQTHKIYKNPYL